MAFPGGIPLSKVVAWYAARLTPGYADGAAVGTIPELSGNITANLTQATLSKRATFQTNEVNGLPVFRFDGTDWYQATWASVPEPYTVFIVFNPKALPAVGGDEVFFAGFKQTSKHMFAIVNHDLQTVNKPSSPPQWMIEQAGNRRYVVGGTPVANTWYVARIDYAATDLITLNGVATEAVGNAGALPSKGITLGAQEDKSRATTGDIAELVFCKNLTSVEKSAVEVDLMTVYGLLAAPADDYPAQPPVGKIFWGATVGANADPTVRHETPTGVPLAVRRSFWQWTHRTTTVVTTATNDLAAGRLPWVSIKTPPWADVGAGNYDAALDAMLNALKVLNGPVWLTVHHEPEGGGPGGNVPDDPSGPVGWLSMQRRVRTRMTALGTTNIALIPVLMGYTWDTRSGRNPESWWADDIFDFLGIDHYVLTESTLLDSIWTKILAFAAAKGVNIGVAEWGMRGTNAAAGQRVHDWYDAAAASTGASRIVALAAFDSNPLGQDPAVNYWQLEGDQLVAFQDLMTDPNSYSLP